MFAVYQRDSGAAFVPPAMQTAGQEFTGNQLHLFRPIRQKGELTGVIFVASDLNELSAVLKNYLGIVGVVFLATLLVALLLSRRLEQLVSDPILQLARVARTVAQDRNYSLRAAKHGEDEIGQLVDGFNEMLAQIQQRDAALQSARDELEARVVERTMELAKTNEALKLENAERRQAEESLRESQSLYHSFVEQLPGAAFRKDREGRFVMVNSQFCQIKGLKPEDFLGKKAREIPDSPEAMQGRRQLQSKYADIGHDVHEEIMRTGNTVETEEEHIDAKGRKMFLRVVRMPVFGADGTVVGTQGIQFDITERKLAEEALQQERNLLRTLIDHIPDYIYVRDISNRFIVANKSFARLMGVPRRAALIGKRDADFYPPEHGRRL